MMKRTTLFHLSKSCHWTRLPMLLLLGFLIPVTVNAQTLDPLLIGITIGTPGSWNNGGDTADKAFDGSVATFFDGPNASNGNGLFTGIDLGSGKTAKITAIRYYPRASYADRMLGGKFQGSNDNIAWTDCYTVGAIPPDSAWSQTTAIASAVSYRYLRYLSPNGGFGNIAEIEFHGIVSTAGQTLDPLLIGITIGTPGSWNNGGDTADKAFDGSVATFFDGPNASNGNGLFTGIDLGGGKTARVTGIRYYPRSGNASRMLGGKFQGSNDNIAWTDCYTVGAIPPDSVWSQTTTIASTGSYRYLRYLSPNSGWGNVAEIEFHGNVSTSGQPTAATPVFTPVSGNFASTQSVSLTDATTGAKIYYTTNGTTPVVGGSGTSLYTASLALNATTTVTAIAVATGYTNSAAATAAYTKVGSTVTYVASLFGAQETPPNNATSTGTCTLVFDPVTNAATVSLNYQGLSSAETDAQIKGPVGPGNSGGTTLYDMPGGTFSGRTWTIRDLGSITAVQIVAALQAGNLYATVYTSTYPAGEIRGQFYPVNGSGGVLPPPPARPNIPNDVDAIRFLEQATFGPTSADAAHVQQIGLRAYLNEQFNAAPSDYTNLQNQNGPANEYYVNNAQTRFFANAIYGTDQLRQKTALALSQILVASWGMMVGVYRQGDSLTGYMNVLSNGAFTNYQQILHDITLNPLMGQYLNMADNVKANPAASSEPNENYAREIMQLFSVGQYKLNLDGSTQVDQNSIPLTNYGNDEVKMLARALTGWRYAANDSNANPYNDQRFADMINPLIGYEPDHDTTAKTLLGGIVIPAGGTIVTDLNNSISAIFNNPSVGPFLCRRLIQHFVTANPSAGYIQRVTAAFNNNGSGVRGDMKAVLSAILLDGEAGGNVYNDPAYGHVKESDLYAVGIVRGLNPTGGAWGLSSYTTSMGQSAFVPRNVFSFYQPDYRQSFGGKTFFDPEDEILTIDTMIARTNFVNVVVNNALSRDWPVYGFGLQPSQTAPVLNFSNYDSLAGNPTQLVQALNVFFLHGAMSAAMGQEIVNAVSVVSPAQPHVRVQQALYLILTSPQYQVAQ